MGLREARWVQGFVEEREELDGMASKPPGLLSRLGQQCPELLWLSRLQGEFPFGACQPSSECGLTELHLLDDLAARMLGVFVGAEQEGGLEGKRTTPLSM